MDPVVISALFLFREPRVRQRQLLANTPMRSARSDQISTAMLHSRHSMVRNSKKSHTVCVLRARVSALAPFRCCRTLTELVAELAEAASLGRVRHRREREEAELAEIGEQCERR